MHVGRVVSRNPLSCYFGRRPVVSIVYGRDAPSMRWSLVLSNTFAVSSNIERSKAARAELEKKKAKEPEKIVSTSSSKKKAAAKPQEVYISKDSPRYIAKLAYESMDLSTPLNINDAVEKLREVAWAKFDETVELSINLNVDPRKPNQSVKGVARLPNGAGKVVRVAVFATADDAIAAKEAGADLVGAEDLVARVLGGDLAFDTVIATPEMMSMVSKIGRVLGPRGLMPNPKMGTVTKEIGRAVKAAKAGAVQFRVEKRGIVQAGVGKLKFTNQALLENIRSFMIAVADAKPEGLKGQYFKTVHISSTMGSSLVCDVPSVDPNSAKFMKTVAELKN